MEELYFQLIRYCVDDTQPLPEHLDTMDWQGLFCFCKEQAIAGVVFSGIERLRQEDIGIPREVLLQWFALSERIRQRNVLMDKRCAELTALLRQDGFGSCILKGQGNTLMYPNPYSRTSGDIDVFLLPAGHLSIGERRQAVTEYVRRRFPKTRIRYQHIDYPIFKGVEIEVHFIPTAKNNPLYNRRLQRWVETQVEAQCAHVVELPDGLGSIAVPTVAFNTVYQLSHLMHHFFDEGIGLRQFVDYYYVLKRRGAEGMVSPEELEGTLRYLNLWKFAGAVMYVMREVFRLEERYMIAPVDERRGRTLMAEILKGGNFGKHSGLTQHSTAAKYFLKHWRNLHFVREYPAEALCEPVFRTWHFFWRLRQR